MESPSKIPLQEHWWWRPYTVLAVTIFIALGVPFLHKHDGDWDVTYLLSARHLWNGQSIYHNGDGYIYPPFPALFALIFAYLPGILPKLAWYGVTVGCFVFLVKWSWKLAGGPELQATRDVGSEVRQRAGFSNNDERELLNDERGDTSSVHHSSFIIPASIESGSSEYRRPGVWLEHLAFILAVIPGATYAFNCISHSQSDLLIGFEMIAGCVAFTRGRSFLAAMLYGLAAAMKGPALIWFPYLIARRKPLAAGWMLVVFFGVNLAPNLIAPSSRHSLLLSDWAHDYLLPKKTANVYPDVWFSESNQSILGCVTRWTTTRWEWKGKTYQQRIPLDHPASPAAVKLITLSIYGLLGLTLATALGWWPRELDRSPGSIRPALEFSLVVILMLAFSPMAAKAQWGVLILPGFCLARLCIIRRDPILIVFFALGWVAWLASQNFVGKNAVFVGLWYGAVLINGLVWFVGCAVALSSLAPKGRLFTARAMPSPET
jgi:hypothetical protein